MAGYLLVEGLLLLPGCLMERVSIFGAVVFLGSAYLNFRFAEKMEAVIVALPSIFGYSREIQSVASGEFEATGAP